jgi:hexosaminidase
VLIPVVPQPAHVSALAGTYTVPKTVTIAAASPDERNVADFAAAFLRERGIAAVIVPNAAGANVRLSTGAASLGNEAYRLRVDSTGISISAKSGAGLYYGLQTLEQLFPVTVRQAQGDEGRNTLHDVAIDDAPAFAWRGIHLDVSRHFFDVPTVERFIDLAAHYKLNTFHWHLSDDQGWRVQIKKYPRLTTFGSCRNGTEVGKNPRDVEGGPYCGYYTQAQIREVVAYAAKRYVTIVPEIDMPGHSTAAIASYPYLGCSGKPRAVSSTWGGSYPICPTEQAISFEEDVLSELMQLFPGPYIHTGGDEVPFKPWKESTFVTGLMKQHHLTTYPQVQAYFERRIEQFVESKGRRMVGWDEILDGGVSRSAVVMSWRGVQGGIKAAKLGNDAVMTPDGPLYLDAYQGDPRQEPLAIGSLSTLQMVYDYDPVAGLTTAEQRSHILGVQANIWTEWIPSVPQLFYMALPRELALSEDAWTASQDKNWQSFEQRMQPQYAFLAHAGYNYRIPNPSISLDAPKLQFAPVSPNVQAVSALTTQANVTISLSEADPGATIFYTTDGSRPDARGQRYAGPLHIALSPGQRLDVRAAAVRADGHTSTVTELMLTRTP